MAGKPTNAEITRQRRAIELPRDRAARSGDVTFNVYEPTAASGNSTGTLYTNETANVQYLDDVFISTPDQISPGDIQATIQVTGDDGEVKAAVAGDIVTDHIDFHGYPLPPGYSIDYDIDNPTGSDHIVTINPMLRGSSSFESATQDSLDPGDTDVIEDFEDSSPLTAYTTTSDPGTIVTSNVFKGSQALQISGDNGQYRYNGPDDSLKPAKGDTFSWRVRPSSVPDDNTTIRCRFMFGTKSADTMFAARMYFDSISYLQLERWQDGTRYVLDEAEYVGFNPGQYHRGQIEWDDTITFRAYDAEGTLIGTVRSSDTSGEPSITSGSFGWQGEVAANESITFDHAVFE